MKTVLSRPNKAILFRLTDSAKVKLHTGVIELGLDLQNILEALVEAFIAYIDDRDGSKHPEMEKIIARAKLLHRNERV